MLLWQLEVLIFLIPLVAWADSEQKPILRVGGGGGGGEGEGGRGGEGGEGRGRGGGGEGRGGRKGGVGYYFICHNVMYNYYTLYMYNVMLE